MKYKISFAKMMPTVIISTLMLVMVGLLTGCQKDNNPASTGSGTTATDDAAMSVASALSTYTGGALDQVGDIATICSSVGLQNETSALLAKYAADSVHINVTKTYDSLTGWWTLTLTRQRWGDYGYAEMNREYRYQFINKDGNFQKFWLTGPDMAYSIDFKIVSGTGYLKTLRFAHHLVSLSGEWMVTGVNKNTITINTINNSPYSHTGSDTITTIDAQRTLNHTLTMTFIDVVGPRGSRLNLSSKTSGTITGTYHATITFTRGSLYVERTIDKTFTITLGGDGTATIHMDGRGFHANADTGILLN